VILNDGALTPRQVLGHVAPLYEPRGVGSVDDGDSTLSAANRLHRLPVVDDVVSARRGVTAARQNSVMRAISTWVG
jgi:hypothetical protein